MADSDVEKKKGSTIVYPRLMAPVIAKAIIAVQKELKPLTKTAKNTEYDSGFVPLPDVMTEAIRLLNERKIAVTQPPDTDEEGRPGLQTILVHETGVGYATRTRLVLAKADPQGHGSALTYARRYALMGILGMTSEADDDDGNRASGIQVPVTDEQKERIKSLCIAMKFPREQIANELWKVKSRDHAALTIKNLEKMASERVRDDEARERATDVETGTKVNVQTSEYDDPLLERIKALHLSDEATEGQLIFGITGKPTLAKLNQVDRKILDKGLKVLENGGRALPIDWYADGYAPEIVEEAFDEDPPEDYDQTGTKKSKQAEGSDADDDTKEAETSGDKQDGKTNR